jgi:hypothetical protein
VVYQGGGSLSGAKEGGGYMKFKKNEPGSPGLIFRNEHESLTVINFSSWLMNLRFTDQNYTIAHMTQLKSG